jgi:hypothetical protein
VSETFEPVAHGGKKRPGKPLALMPRYYRYPVNPAEGLTVMIAEPRRRRTDRVSAAVKEKALSLGKHLRISSEFLFEKAMCHFIVLIGKRLDFLPVVLISRLIPTNRIAGGQSAVWYIVEIIPNHFDIDVFSGNIHRLIV